MAKRLVTVRLRLTEVQRGYLERLVQEVAKKPCHRSNCGTVCKCAKHMALDLLEEVERAVERNRREVQNREGSTRHDRRRGGAKALASAAG